MANLETTVLRASYGILAGAIIGGVIVATLVVVTLVAESPNYGQDHFGWGEILQGIAAIFTGYFAVATLVWLVGLVLFAVPPWLYLHQNGRRDSKTAMALGSVLSTTAGLVLNIGAYGAFRIKTLELYEIWSSQAIGFSACRPGECPPPGFTAMDWIFWLANCVLLGAVGAAVGYVVWRTSYRRTLIANRTIKGKGLLL